MTTEPEPVRGILFPDPIAGPGRVTRATQGAAPPPDRIMQLAHGFMAAKFVFVAADVGLFAAVGTGRATLDEIAQRCGLPVRTTRILADALVMFGLLENDGTRYRNAADAEAFLSGRGPLDIRPVLRYFDKISYPSWAEAETAMRTGRGVRRELDSVEAEAYERAVAVVTAPGATALADEYDFGRHRRVLDVGGGIGTFMEPTLARYEHLTWTLLDLPDVVEMITKGDAASRPHADRIDYSAVDVFADPIPGGYDAILVAHFIHLFPPERNLELLGRLRGAATPDGRLLLVDWWFDSTAPHPNTIFGASEFLMISGGDTYRLDEVAEWLSQTGWQPVEHRPLVAPMSLLVAEAA